MRTHKTTVWVDHLGGEELELEVHYGITWDNLDNGEVEDVVIEDTLVFDHATKDLAEASLLPSAAGEVKDRVRENARAEAEDLYQNEGEMAMEALYGI